MAMFLNTPLPYKRYKKISETTYFVDKTCILNDVLGCIEEETQYICITRPRRFGKTIMANMLGAFLGKGWDSSQIFDHLKIAGSAKYQKYLNQYDIIYIDFSRLPENCTSYQQYINRIITGLKSDLKNAYPEYKLNFEAAVWDMFSAISDRSDQQFIFIMDEWDAVFHMPFITETDKAEYILFLKTLLKDQDYVALAYITGILPISKYSSGSELNMFAEFTMTTEQRFSEYFGFTDEEVDGLYLRYIENCASTKMVTRDDLREWYDGYHTRKGERLYNPRSIVLSLSNNNTGNYWTSSGPYDEIFYYIENNIADVREDLALMVSGIPVPAKIQEYAATSMNLQTRDEIFSAMVVYGFLTYENGKVMIPNKELMNKFADMLKKEASLGYVHRLAKESDRMLRATLAGDTETMAEILELAYDTEIPLLSYNDETELTAVVNLVYLSARDNYRVEREDKSGVGYVDFIFYPVNRDADGIILELKVDHSPDEAIRQIKDKKYILRFTGKLGEERKCAGRILAVGISYNKKQKKHACKVEVLN